MKRGREGAGLKGVEGGREGGKEVEGTEGMWEGAQGGRESENESERVRMR